MDTAIVHTTTPKTTTENVAIRKRSPQWSDLKIDAFWNRCFLVWTEKTMLSENVGVNKMDTTGSQTTLPWLSKMADRRSHVASISRNFAGRYIKIRMRRVHMSIRTEGMKAFSKRIRRCSVDGRKRYGNVKCGRKSCWKRGEKAPFSFENGLVWTGP